MSITPKQFIGEFLQNEAERLQKCEKILTDTLKEVPCGNVIAHTIEKLPESMKYYVQQCSILDSVDSVLLDIVGRDSVEEGVDLALKVKKEVDILKEQQKDFKKALELIAKGTSFSKEIAEKCLGIKHFDYQIELLWEENLELKLKNEKLKIELLNKTLK